MEKTEDTHDTVEDLSGMFMRWVDGVSLALDGLADLDPKPEGLNIPWRCKPYCR